jgi:3',5'-cyclic AMP phosphodiesterase CpdA
MKIVHISDIHCNLGSDFDESMFKKGLTLLNTEKDVDFVFISGDLTSEGLLSEYEMAKRHVDMIDHRCVIVPGNHDERNLGYHLFPEFFGIPSFTYTIGDISFVGLASSEPDKDDGHLGRARHTFIETGVTKDKPLTIVGFHHHLIPVPNSGREANIIEDAGETLDILLRHQVPLVLMGHRHVPYAIRLHETLLVNAGTFSCTRTRAHFGHTYNIINLDVNHISISVMQIETGKKKVMIEVESASSGYVNHFCDPLKSYNK